MSRFFLVLNPGSRSFRCRHDWLTIFAHLRDRQVDFDFALTEREGQAATLARAATARGFDVVVAVGGDGTINEVINGLYDSATGSCHPAFGVIYTGTSPDFCRYHQIPVDIPAAINLLISGQPQKVDVCRISYRPAPKAEPVERVLACSANFGLGAAIARGANSGLRRRLGDLPGTLTAAILALIQTPPGEFRLCMDGREERLSRVYNLFAGKNPLIASGITLRLPIAPDDGRLFVLPLGGFSRLRMLALLPHLYTGTLTRRFPPRFASTLEIADVTGVSEVEFDGDPRGFLPAAITVLPRALALIRPPLSSDC